jgi:hypothetical protein
MFYHSTMKAAIDYIVRPIDNTMLSLRTAEGRKEAWRAFVQVVFALLVLGLCVAFNVVSDIDFSGIADAFGAIVDGFVFVIAAIAMIPLALILVFLLSILAVPFMVFFGILSIGSRD